MAYLGRQPIIGNYQVLDAITASATATYALTKNSVAVFPQTPANCIVSLNGVIQAPFDSYTISGSNIVFASALTGSDSIDFITVLGDVLNVGTVSDNTITTAKLADSSVSLAKLTATGTKDATTFLRGDNTFASAGGANTPAFKATKNTTTSLTAGTYTKVPFNNEIFDTDSCYDNVTNYRFTPNVAGKYLIYGHLWSYMQSTAAQSSQFRTSLYKNGAEDFTATVLQGTSGNNIQQENAINIVSIQEANGTTDYFEIYVRVSDNNATMYQGEFGAYKIIE
jgi:hypothetical protein